VIHTPGPYAFDNILQPLTYIIIQNAGIGSYIWLEYGWNDVGVITPSNMTNSNAQLWDNGISAIGTWINSMKTNLGDILLVLTTQNIMIMKDTEIQHIFMIGE